MLSIGHGVSGISHKVGAMFMVSWDFLIWKLWIVLRILNVLHYYNFI